MNRQARRRAEAMARRSAPVIGGLVSWKPGMVDLTQKDRVTLAGVTVKGEGINAMARATLEHETAKILKQHGARAFAAPKPAAAIHEAGHVVMCALLGWRVVGASIAPYGNENWIGYTKCPDAAFTETATAEANLKAARNLIAGVTAEQMFDADFRQGSSLDEVMMSQLVGARAAQQKGDEPETYWRDEVWSFAVRQLRHNGRSVVAIANRLMQRHELFATELQELCASVETA